MFHLRQILQQQYCKNSYFNSLLPNTLLFLPDFNIYLTNTIQLVFKMFIFRRNPLCVPHLREIIHLSTIVPQTHALPHRRQTLHLCPVRQGFQGTFNTSGENYLIFLIIFGCLLLSSLLQTF
jgi:hypothetical protein